MRCRTLTLAVFCAAAIAAPQAQTHAFAQVETPPQSTIRGENFSAKPAPALFASDCTGSNCHKGPQGLARRPGLASFLREHYTNSRESAAALANYLSSIPAAVNRETTRPIPPGRVRTGTPPEEEATAPPARGRRSAEPVESAQQPARTPRGQRGRQATAAPSSEPAEPSEQPTPAATPPAQVFDIFD